MMNYDGSSTRFIQPSSLSSRAGCLNLLSFCDDDVDDVVVVDDGRVQTDIFLGVLMA